MRGASWAWIGLLAGLAGCQFVVAPVGADDAAGRLPWWDAAWAFRRPLAVAAGPKPPLGGYDGYTVRLAGVDTAALIAAGKLRAGCEDLRVLRWDGAAWTELPRQLLGCGGAAAELRFRLRADIAAGAVDASAWLHYGDPAAAAPPPPGTTDVYLWWDDATVDRGVDYQRGRMDSWGSTNNWIDLPAWNASGWYDYDRLDDQVSSYRRAVDERDVYVEAELWHVACYPSNMVTGVVVRGVIAAGDPGAEEADHYYATMRGEQAACGGGYGFDGDIVKTVRDQPVIDGPNPPALVTGQWRKQALAAWGANPTNLTFWDADTGWPAPGWPDGHVQVTGADPDDHEGAGFAGLWIAQDGGRFRNLLVRRYVEPEPVVSAGAEEARLTPAP